MALLRLLWHGNPKAFFEISKPEHPSSQSSEFPDHHRYDQRDTNELEQVARAGSKAFITTERTGA
jgi:tetraacyldisaccharide-1-P 4'-kinase